MKDLNNRIFILLFKEVCEKGFRFPLVAPLSETDSKLLSSKIFEKTGLVIGAKSIKNYSFYVLDGHEDKKENPSVATLDTFARYVLDAPYTDEIRRKTHESHFPYWFEYRNKFAITAKRGGKPKISKKRLGQFTLLIVCILVGTFLISFFMQKQVPQNFRDDFISLQVDPLGKKGWMIKSRDPVSWAKHAEKTGHLTLYTQKGDNWEKGKLKAEIKNLLMRRILSDCFSVEVHMSDFMPEHNWQQAGLLLSEDSTFTGKMIRLTISYNDFFGGYEKPAEIIIQGISSSESGHLSKPEEIIHFPIFTIETGSQNFIKGNMAKSALKIEKKGKHFRFLFISSPIESFAFKEVLGRDFDFQPQYVGIFAMQGWAEKENLLPVHFDSFSLVNIACE